MTLEATRTTKSAAGTVPVVPARNGAEAIIQLFVAQGVDYLFYNPGTDTAPLQEAIVSLERQGQKVPRIVTCLYENVAIAAAHAYFAATGRPQVVVVHVDAGTQNLGANLHNAQRGQGGVVILAGRTPYTLDTGTPGGRDRGIQWHQDRPDQISIVRDYVKWSHELNRTDTLHHLIPRAFQLAASQPAGPVYMMAAREVLMEPMNGVAVLPRERYGPYITPAADPVAIEQLAAWLAEAKSPLVITTRAGRDPAVVAHFVALADLLGVPVTNARDGLLNIPTTHPLALAEYSVGRFLKQADLVLLVDVEVPWIPSLISPPEHARIAQIDLNPIKPTIPLWGFPVDLPIMADPAKALNQLLEAVERIATPERRRHWQERRDAIAAARQASDDQDAEQARQSHSSQPITVDALARALAEVLDDDTMLVEEATTSAEALRRYVRRTRPGTLFHVGAPGLGFAMGGALGFKLAEPERTVVAAVGDGTFVFDSPIAALWAAQQAQAPFLTVIFNNGGYNASKLPVLNLFPAGASAQADAFPGVRFPTPPDYATVARGCHAHGEKVEQADDLIPALRRGLEAVANGQAAVLDVVLKPI